MRAVTGAAAAIAVSDAAAGLFGAPDFFTTLGVGPVMGRSFNEAETITPIENHAAILLTHAYWHQHFTSDPHERSIRASGHVKDMATADR